MFETAQPKAGAANQPEKIESPESRGAFPGEKAPASATQTGGEERREEKDGPELFPGEEPFLTVRYNKQDRHLSKEEAAGYAQKGLNYDKLESRYRRLCEKLGESAADPDGEAEREAVGSQLEEFLRRNPGAQIPDEVAAEWKRGVPLAEAYLRHRTKELSARIAELERAAAEESNRRNEEASMGRASEGASNKAPLCDERIRSMTPEELDSDHERIWSYLTGGGGK